MKKVYLVILPLLALAIGANLKQSEPLSPEPSVVELKSQTLGSQGLVSSPLASSSKVLSGQVSSSLVSLPRSSKPKDSWRSNEVHNRTASEEKAVSESPNSFIVQKSNPYKTLFSGLTEENSPVRNSPQRNTNTVASASSQLSVQKLSVQNYLQNTVSLETKSTASNEEITSISDERYNPYTELFENPSASSGSIQNYIANVTTLSPQ